MNSGPDHVPVGALACASLVLMTACVAVPDAADAPRPETLAAQLGLALQSHRDMAGTWPLDARDFVQQLESVRRAQGSQSDTLMQAMLPDTAYLRDLRFTQQPDGALRVNFRMRTRGAPPFEFLVTTNAVKLGPAEASLPRQP